MQKTKTATTKKKIKIFISHSVFDAEIAQALVDLLVNGVGLDESLIFCSSVAGHDIPLGVNFNDFIIEQLTGYDAQVIALISSSYYNSKYCLYEMGAAWGLCKSKIIPVLIYDMKYANLQDFISYNQAIKADEEKHVNKLCDFFRQNPAYPNKQVVTDKYESERKKFIDIIQKARPSPVPKNAAAKENVVFKYKAVVFDFDGTILQGQDFKYSWKAVWQHLKFDDQIRRTLYDKHYKQSSTYSYQDWCNECCNYFIQEGFNLKHVKEIFKIKKLHLSEGFELTVKLLKSFGFRIGIISGGINSFIEEAIPNVTFESIDKIFVNRFFYGKNGELTRVEAYPDAVHDGTGKVRAMESFCKQFGFTPSDVVFVGEGLNDIDVAGVVGKAISYPAKKASDGYNNLANVTTVHDENMAAILSHILIPKS